MSFFSQSGSYVEKTIRGRELRFYPVSIWQLWTGQLRAVSGLMGAVAELVGLAMTKPAAEVVENSDEAAEGMQPGYFRRVNPPDPKANQAWTELFARAVERAWTEATKENVLETFCLLLLDSLRGQETATVDRAKELARELDMEAFVEMAIPFFEASLAGMSGPMRQMLKTAINKGIDRARKQAQTTQTATSAPSETT